MAAKWGVTDASVQQLERQLRSIGRGDIIEASIARAINRGAVSIKTGIARQIAKDTGLGSRRVAQDTRIIRASKKRPVARIIVTSEAVNLRRFQARQTQKGVTVQVLKSNGRKLIKSAFIGKGRLNGQVYTRFEGERRIRKRRGPSPASLLKQTRNIEPVLDIARRDISPKVLREVLIRVDKALGRL